MVYETKDLIDKALIEGFGHANEPHKLLHDRRGRRVPALLPCRKGIFMRKSNRRSASSPLKQFKGIHEGD
jgi:hypothetical protein